MTAKRILIVTNRVPYPLNDGGNLAMSAMVEGYHKAGWEVFLLSMNTSRHYVAQATLNNIYRHIYRFEAVDINNDVKALPTIANFLFSRQPSHAVRFTKAAFAQKLEDAIMSFKPSAIQIESVFLSGYLPLIRQISDAIIILRLHNVEYQVWARLANETRSILKKVYLRSLAKRIERYEKSAWIQYDLLLPITKEDEAIVTQLQPDANTIVVPFGIDIGNAAIPSANEKWEGYHLGAMDWLPNEQAINWFLVDVWPELHRAVPEFRFFFAGRNMPDSFLTLRIDGVFCNGEVPDANVFIADKKILIVPLRSGGGIRVKILEAMAVGKVIISTSVGMQGIAAIPQKHYLQANTASEFVSAVKWIVENREQALKIAENAAALIKTTYSSEIIMEDLLTKLNKSGVRTDA